MTLTIIDLQKPSYLLVVGTGCLISRAEQDKFMFLEYYFI